MKIELLGIIYVVIILIFTLVGIKRGLFATLVSFIKSFLSFVISTFISKPIATMLVKTNLGTKWADSMADTFAKKGGTWIETYSEATSNITIKNIKLPNAVSDLFDKILGKCADMAGEGATVAQVAGYSVVYYSLIVIVFILSFIAIRLLCLLLKRFFKLLESVQVIKFVNRLGGGALGFAIGGLFVCLIAYGLSFVVSLNTGISEWLIDDMQLNNDTFTIAKWFYNTNIISWLASAIQNIF